MLTLPDAIVPILAPFATLFTNPTLRKAQLLMVGAILAQGSIVERGVNVLAFGLPGTGKTHALCALGHRLVEGGRSILFALAYRLVQSLPLRRHGNCWPSSATWTCPAGCASWTTSTSSSWTTWATCPRAPRSPTSSSPPSPNATNGDSWG